MSSAGPSDNYPDRRDVHEGQPARKRRKARPQLSCKECRRLKMRCDRSSPCSNCVRRQCEDLCVWEGAEDDEAGASNRRTSSNPLEARVQYLESLLSAGGRQRSVEADQSSSSDLPGSSTHAGTARDTQPQSSAHPYPHISQNPLEPTHINPEIHFSETGFGIPPSNTRPLRSEDVLLENADTAHPGQLMLPIPDGTPIVDAPAMVASASSQTGAASKSPLTRQKSQHSHQDPHLEHPPLQSQQSLVQPQGQLQQPADEINSDGSNEEQSYGTLLISQSGSSRYLGRTAGGEWLKNQEVIGQADSPPPDLSRMPSPSGAAIVNLSSADWHGSLHAGTNSEPEQISVAFPFNTASRLLSTAALLKQLPPRSDAYALLESYYRHFSWHFNVIRRDALMPILEEVYQIAIGSFTSATSGLSKSVRPERLALIYVILAMGSFYSLELAPDDSSVEEYLMLSRACLAKADFLANNTIAGVQTLFIMSHLILSMDSGKNGDQAWPLWGLTTRTIQAMGLHRDGEKWGLPPSAIEERRRVFWECHATDVMTSNCFSRPGAISPDYIDTKYPTKTLESGHDLDSFKHAQFDLSKLFGGVLDHSMKVRVPPYSTVQALHAQITRFELDLPFQLRCRPVLCTIPSSFPDPQDAIKASPEVNKRDLQGTFQESDGGPAANAPRFTMSMNISELLIFLHRPYFARAVNDFVRDPSRSPYALSYLSVVERCNATLTIISTLYGMYPQAAARHWWLWYHAFNAAACMGTLVLKCPSNLLAGFALSLVDSTIGIYTSAVHNRNSRRMVKNLRWLIHLRSKIGTRLSQQQSPDTGLSGTEGSQDGGEEDDVELLGWKTRLIQRAGKGSQVARTISSARRAVGGGGKSGSGISSGGQHAGSVGSLSGVTFGGGPFGMGQAEFGGLSSRPGEHSEGLLGVPGREMGSNEGMFDFGLPPTDELGQPQDPPSISSEALLSQFWDPSVLHFGSTDASDLASMNWWNLGVESTDNHGSA